MTAVVLGEVVPLLALVFVVAVWGPSDPAEAAEFARAAGAWVGPLAGALALLGLTYWAGRTSSRPVLQGAAIGIVVAMIDFTILFMADEPFAWLFVVSNGGKVIAGVLGGWLAAIRADRAVAEARGPAGGSRLREDTV